MHLKSPINLLEGFTFLSSLCSGSIKQVIESSQIDLIADLKVADQFLCVHVVDAALPDQYLQECCRSDSVHRAILLGLIHNLVLRAHANGL